MITLYHWPQKDLQCSAAPGEKINDENHLAAEPGLGRRESQSR